MSPLSMIHMGDPRNLEKMVCHACSAAGTVPLYSQGRKDASPTVVAGSP